MKKRTSAVVALLCASAGTTAAADPATNSALGGTIASFISYMKSVNNNSNGLAFIRCYLYKNRNSQYLFVLLIAICCYFKFLMLVICFSQQKLKEIKQFNDLRSNHIDLSLLVPV